MPRSIHTVSTSKADDAAFRSLADIARITRDFPDTRIVGGHMAGLLLLAYPVESQIERRTVDADAAVSTLVAGGGQLHTLLLAAGYRALAGNHYELGDRAIDLLVPAAAGRFGQEIHGGRAFDAAPGIFSP